MYTNNDMDIMQRQKWKHIKRTTVVACHDDLLLKLIVCVEFGLYNKLKGSISDTFTSTYSTDWREFLHEPIWQKEVLWRKEEEKSKQEEQQQSKQQKRQSHRNIQYKHHQFIVRGWSQVAKVEHFLQWWIRRM
jgi:hypothetical protein